MKGKTVFHVCLATVLFLVLLLSPVMTVWAQDQEEEFSDFSELSLEDMLNVTVTSASKVEQSIWEAPNSITVITAEDIRRSGSRTIPEALRMAPGVLVTQISGNNWVVTIGGFGLNSYANKLLVLVDGVSVYDTRDGSVNWARIPVAIDEVERIEVIRGPGGVIYGSNAVNGIINIITRSSASNSPNYLNVTAGTQGQRTTAAATTIKSDDGQSSSRLAVEYNQSQGFGMKDGEEIHDGRNGYVVSTRNSVNFGGDTRISLDGRFRSSDDENPYLATLIEPDNTYHAEYGITTIRLDQKIGEGEFYIQSFYRRNTIRRAYLGQPSTDYSDSMVADVEAQATIPFEAAGQNTIIIGGGYRDVTEKFGWILDDEQGYDITNAYFNHEWRPVSKVIWNAGVKWEDMSIIDPTWQWRGSLTFLPAPEQSLRFSAASASRSPALSELFYDIRYPIGPTDPIAPIVPPGTEYFAWVGNENLKPEQVISYEAQYRGLWFNRALVDVTYSYKQYEHLISVYQSNNGFYVPIAPPPVPPIGPFDRQWSYNDKGKAETHTVEVGADVKFTNELSLKLNYAYLDIEVSDEVFDGYEDNTPHNYGRVGLSYYGQSGFMTDVSAAYVDKFTVINPNPDGGQSWNFDEYWRLDARIAQRIKVKNGDVEVGVVGQNLGQEWHEENWDFNSDIAPFEIRRAYYGYVEYRVK